MKSPINWFEIPVVDFERAKRFYAAMLSCEINDMPMPGTKTKYAMFPYELGLGTGGVLVYGEEYKPSITGSLIYFNAGEGDNISSVLSRVEKAGGKIVLPKTSIGQYGFIAHIIDSEGNKVALHSRLAK